MEGVTEIDCQLSAEHHGFWIIAINVDNWCADDFCRIGAIQSGAGIVNTAGGKANLIIDNNVHSATDFEATGLRHLE